MDMPALPIALQSRPWHFRPTALTGPLLYGVVAAVVLAGLRASVPLAADPPAGEQIVISTGEPGNGPVRVIGTEGHRQLVVSAVPAGADSEQARDITRQAIYRVEPETLAKVTPEGVVVPSADGQGEIVVSVSAVPGLTGLPETRVPLVVERFGNDPPVEFYGHVVPVFTKYGCNGGGCHGKSGGQNGFRLSLLGFEPTEDHEHLVKEARGRRLSITAPDESLLLLKAAAIVPHGGGKLIETGSPAYRLLSRWIAEGAQPGDANAPRVVGIEVFPTVRVMHPGQSQQIRVMAILSNGSREDVTPMAQYEVNAPELASVDKTGLVSAADRGNGPPRSGVAALMVRYQSQVAVFRATIPLESPVDRIPARSDFARNFIDRHVLDNLVALSLPPSGRCDDATFLRRATIDIAGRTPTLDETRAFLASTDANKRDKLVDRLLDSPDYADFFANKWSAILRNKRTNDTLHRHGSYAFHD